MHDNFIGSGPINSLHVWREGRVMGKEREDSYVEAVMGYCRQESGECHWGQYPVLH